MKKMFSCLEKEQFTCKCLYLGRSVPGNMHVGTLPMNHL